VIETPVRLDPTGRELFERLSMAIDETPAHPRRQALRAVMKVAAAARGGDNGGDGDGGGSGGGDGAAERRGAAAAGGTAEDRRG